MQWGSILLLILQWLYQYWKEQKAKTREDEESLRRIYEKQLALLDAIEKKDAGAISRRARDRAYTLSLLLSDPRVPEGDKSKQ